MATRPWKSPQHMATPQNTPVEHPIFVGIDPAGGGHSSMVPITSNWKAVEDDDMPPLEELERLPRQQAIAIASAVLALRQPEADRAKELLRLINGED